MPRKVMCTVNTCHYWNEGNECGAQEILVTSDVFANYAPPNIDSTTASTLSATPSNAAVETACKTFVPRGAAMEEKQADQVLKDQASGNVITE